MKYKYWKPIKDTKRGAKNTGLAILNLMAGMAEVVDVVSISKKDIYHALYKNFGEDWAESKCASNLYELKRRGYLEYEGANEQASVRFTDKAKIKTLETLSDKIESDGKNRFISFDIPEINRAKRDQFRQALKDLGCQKIQSSLWVSDRNIGKFIEMAAYTFGVEQYVVYIVAEKSDIDGIIEKKFTQPIKKSKPVSSRKLHRKKVFSAPIVRSYLSGRGNITG